MEKEKIGENKDISSKITKLIEKSNKLLLEDLTAKGIYKQFKKLLIFSSLKTSKIENENDFLEFIYGFEKVFKDLEIKKLYNISNTSDIENFDKLDLFKQFFYISIPYRNKSSFKFIKWWVCYHWSIFFYNFFNHIDRKNKLSKEIIYFKKDFDHSVFLIWFKNKKFIIDPYSKSKWLLTVIKKWEKVYLSMNKYGYLFWEIKDDKNLTIYHNGKKVILSIYKTKRNFLKNIRKNKTFLVNLKTYVNQKPTHLIIKQAGDFILIKFDWYKQWSDKEMIIINIMGPIMEWKVEKIDNFFLLKQILWIKEIPWINDKIIKKLKVISEKIPANYLLEILWIKEDVKMFM